MNKKKILALCLIVCLLSVAVVGGTLAYFTDTDAAKNVMTTGKVDIIQIEQQRDANGALVDFADNKPLMPMVNNCEANDPVVVDGFFNSKMNNVVDKIVTVKNEAPAGAINQNTYVRTILAFETNTEYEANTTNVLRDGKEIFRTYIGTLGSFTLLDRDTVVVNGVEYVVAVKVYEKALAPQEVSTPSLKQIFLSPDANNEVATLFGDDYTILALSQATQTAGFATAEEALNKAFGNLETMDEATLIEWLEACA